MMLVVLWLGGGINIDLAVTTVSLHEKRIEVAHYIRTSCGMEDALDALVMW